MPTLTPFLWFEHQAEQAAKFYRSVFKKSKITDVVRYGEAGPGRKGTVMTVAFELEGQEFVGLNGGPYFKFTPAISFVVNCRTQAEADYFWEKLSKGGKKRQCGWLTDKFGVTWQIVPKALFKYIQGRNPKKSQQAMRAMMKMTKLNIAGLKRAYDAK